MMDATTILRAGGIAPTSARTAADLRVGGVSAHRYGHPAIPGRTVVRLVADVMAPGADVEMETLGFTTGAVTAKLGKRRFRALGFPGWALVNDPPHAKFALEVMKDFKRAAAQVRSKPGNARDGFVEIALRLGRSVPHFLPSFWEEAGRRFLAEESTTFAAQAFEKARQAEKEHALPVDEDVRSSVYLEFALAGAVAAKSLAGYAKELGEAYGPAAAYPRYLELATRRILGGMPPWVGLAKELRALAKAAGLDLDAEDAAFLLAVLDAPAITRAPAELWTTYRASLLRLAKEKPEVRRRLRGLFPRPSSGAKDDFPGWWLALIVEAGALEGVVDATRDDADPAGSAASWLGGAIAFTGASKALLAHVPALAPRLRADAAPVSILHSSSWRHTLAIDFAESLLELGIPVFPPARYARFDLTRPMVCDPVRVQADPVLGPLLLDAVEGALGTPPFEEAAKGRVGLSRARGAWLSREVGRLSGRGLFDAAAAAERLRTKVRAELWREFPELAARASNVDVSAALAFTLRAGLFAEWTWPVFEEVHARDLGDLTLHGAWPYPVLCTKTKALVLGADRILLEHDFVLPPKAYMARTLYADGDLLVIMSVPQVGSRAYWASSPNDVFEMDGYMYLDFPVSITLPGGGTTVGGPAIHRGDTNPTAGGTLSTDGTQVWIDAYEDGRYKLREIDPKTGTKGRFSWPAFVEPFAALDDGLRIITASVTQVPEGVTASPFGQKDGLLGIVHRGPQNSYESGRQQVVRIDGATWDRQGQARPLALMDWPGVTGTRAVFARSSGRRGRQGSGHQIEDANGIVFASVADRAGATVWPVVPHVSLWSYLRVRDDAGSAALRSLGDDAAKGLLEAAAAGATSEDDPKQVLARVEALVPGVTSAALREEIARTAIDAGKLAAALASIGAGSADTTTNVDETAAFDALVPVLAGRSRYASGSVIDELGAVTKALDGAPLENVPKSRIEWDLLVGHLRGVAMLGMLSGTTREHRVALATLLGVFRSSLFARGGHAMRTFDGRIDAGSPALPKADGELSVVRHDGSQFVFRSIADGGAWSTCAIEIRPGGAFTLPPGVTITRETVHPDRDDAAYLEGLDALLASEPPPWDPEAAGDFARATGLTRAEATLLLTGLPRMQHYESDYLGKELRERLGLKTTDAKIAKESLRTLDRKKYLEVLTRGAPEDPADLARPWSESGLAARLAEAYVAVFGKKTPVRDELVLACERELDPPLPSSALLTAVASTEQPTFLRVPEPTFEVAFRWSNGAIIDHLTVSTLQSLAGLLPWLYGGLPAGDPYRDAVPRVLASVLEVLSDPKLLLPLRSMYVEEKDKPRVRQLVELVGGEDVTIAMNNDASDLGRDSGSFVAALFRGGARASFAFRPARMTLEDPVGRAITGAASEYGQSPAWEVVGFLRSPGLRAIAARIERGAIPAGAYEANPLASAPEVVAAVVKAKKLPENAAVHYLQLLALLEPTSRSVQLWNGWKPAEYKQTCTELLDAKLVVTGKRERAGRDVFLPGGWDKPRLKKDLPFEAWKKPLYPPGELGLQRAVFRRPIPEIFAEAWARIVAGDIPKLEEV